MAELGIMLYGYPELQARAILEALEGATGQSIRLISASGQESERVEAILDREDTAHFEERDDRMVMFLGFDDRLVDTALKAFPEGMKRPIFCGLTENNLGWKLAYLFEHLRAEREYFQKHGEPAPDED